MDEVEKFQSSLIRTNKPYHYFVDWSKVNENTSKYRDELALLKVLSTDGIDLKKELERLLRSYPKLIELLPLLAAVRPKKYPLSVLEDDLETIKDFYFGSRDVEEADIQSAVEFSEKTGLLESLATISDPFDYYFGVEVGIDTNARKNRSGQAMEILVGGHVRALAEKVGGTFEQQRTFNAMNEKYDTPVPKYHAKKRGDFMVILDKVPINIETNFFDGGGSKQEIMDSYITRKQHLNEAGWGFGLVTDGYGWKGGTAQLEKGFSTIKHIFNIEMVKSGNLTQIAKDLH